MEAELRDNARRVKLRSGENTAMARETSAVQFVAPARGNPERVRGVNLSIAASESVGGV